MTWGARWESRTSKSVALLTLAVWGAFCEVASAQNGACCLGNGTCVNTDAGGCTVLAGEFLGAGTSCTPNICIGACCTADKGCLENNRDACTAAPGSFQGAGTTCDLNCPSHLGTGFTYQGQLKEGGVPLTDSVDLEFSLWTAAEGGDPVGLTQNLSDVEVLNGLFTVVMDFGIQAFAGNSRFLEAAVRRPHDPTDTAPFVTLSPRQEITAAPYALKVPGIDGHSLDTADGSPVDALFVDNIGRVGIGTNAPSDPLTVTGVIRSITGGFEFPDGTTQTTAADITGVMAGSGLSGGGQSGDVTLSIPTGGVTSSHILDGTISAADLGTNSLGADEIAANAVGSSEIAANAVTAAKTLDEPGVASNTSGVIIALNGTVQTILSRVITAPAAGYVLVMASAEAFVNHSFGSFSFALFGVSDVAGTFPPNQDVAVQVSPSAGGGNYAYAVTVHGLFSVSAGSNTFFFLADEISGSWEVRDVQLTLVYFPTAYGTVVSTQAATAGADGADGAAVDAQVPPDPLAQPETVDDFEPGNLEREVADLKARLAALEAMVARSAEPTPTEGQKP